ncbi:MAG TPA: hypothetical protein VGP79_05720 [Bryobacteraceae bacterium]|jgi:hypothetical protein|nr:hypothetical protein [Bryobacteraceae bacterium]
MLRRLEQRWAAFARRKTLAIVVVGLLPLLLRVVLLAWMPVPSPRVHDEFSHLLVADTLAHGRLVNPEHPMWMHFESMHTLVRPVYASAFPMASGFVMAWAQMLTGNPWIGVWLSVGLMCAALCWMLQGWVSPSWALLGGVLAATRFGVFSYWMNSYYGGAVAAVGGAMVLGALGRILRSAPGTGSRRRNLAVMGIGLAILANSRPFEGAIFAAPLVAALVWITWRRERRLTTLVPLVLVIAATAAALGYYCARVTGNPLQLPYSFYRSTHTLAPHFVWQSPRPEPAYLHRVLHDYYTGWEMGCYHDARANRPPHGVADKIKSYWRFYLGPLLTIPLLAIPWMWQRPRTRWLLLLAVFFGIGLMGEVWNSPHYAAPALGLMLLLVIEGLRHLRRWAGPIAVAAVALGCILTPVVGGSNTSNDGRPRARIGKQLETAGGRHLVVVRYRLDHNVGDEWVYNSADIDGSPIVWAREMDPTSNRNLLRYFSGRKAWLVEPDAEPPRLSEYDPSLPPDPPFRFVKLGTEGVQILRSAEEVVRRVSERAAPDCGEHCRLSCDQWNGLFTQSTGIEGPDPARGCFPPDDRQRKVDFRHWFDWLKQQR